MGFNRGISANTKLPPGNKSSGLGVIEQVMSRIKGGIQIGRVTDIILNQNYPNIKKYGGTSAIGTIFYESNVELQIFFKLLTILLHAELTDERFEKSHKKYSAS